MSVHAPRSKQLGLRRLRLLAFALALIAPSAQALVQPYPTHAVTVVLPVRAGGGLNAVGRILAQRVGEELGQKFVVENRPGGATSVGSAYVARSAPDGYTLLVNASPLILGPMISKHVPYDPLTDFEPITQITSGPLILVASPKFPGNTVTDLISLAKSHPHKFSIAKPGTGSSMDFAQAAFRYMTGIDLLTPSYTGTGAAVAAVLHGTVTATFATVPSVLFLVRKGALKALAVTGHTRTGLMEGIPTVAESGLPGFEFNTWHGFWAPAKTPRAIISRLQAATRRAIERPAVRRLFLAQGLEPVGSTPEQFAQFIRREQTKYADLIKEMKLKFN